MMDRELLKNEDMWSPFKELQSFVEGVVSQPIHGVLQKVQEVLRKHKQNFLTLLKNPPKNSQHREELRKGITEGIMLPGIGHQTLSKEIVDEAIIISDMYDLNEFVALDLLCTAQQRMPHHPGLPRGLVAVLLYYDGRRALVYALRALVQARNGISWTVSSTEEVTRYITRYTQELMDHGVINRILGLLETMDLTSELELLQQNRAIGGPRHQRQILDMFQDIRQGLADTVYCWAAQCGLPREPTFRLMGVLKNLKIEDDPAGGIDSVTLALEMALLYAVDLSIIQKREDGEDVVKNLPLLAEADFLRELVRELTPSGGQVWQCTGLQALTQFAVSLSLATLRRAPQNLQPFAFSEEDEILVDSAIELNVFDFLHQTFLINDSLYNEAFYLQRLHTLITDFIMFMPFKVKELRNRADETARTMQVYMQEGLEPPARLPHHYEHMLLAMARLYHCDRLQQELVLEYWNPPEENRGNILPFRSTPRKMLLSKFVYEGGTELLPSLFVPHMKMLCSLASTPKAARYAFSYLKNNSASNVSWNHFFKSLERYYSNLRQELPPTTDTVYQSRSYPRGISPQEIHGLQAVLDIVRTVAENDSVSRVALCENTQWQPLSILLGLVTCSVPIPLKADLLRTLAALARSPDTAITLWFNFETSQILSTIPSASSYQPRGVQTELEEIESRNEEYPLTRALLSLLDVLTDVPIPRLLGLGTRAPGFDPYLNFVINSVFLRFNTRIYKNPKEKWEVAKGCVKLFVKLLSQYEPQEEDFSPQYVDLQSGGSSQVNPPPGYHLMVNLNSKTELLQRILFLIEEGVQMLDSFIPFPGKEALEASLESCLALLDRTLVLQPAFSALLSTACTPLLIPGLSRLLLDVNPRSGQTDYLLLITKYVTYNSWLPQHANTAVKILLAMTSQPSSQNQMVTQFTSTAAMTAEIRQGFVECLEANEEESLNVDGEEVLSVQAQTKLTIIKLLQQCLCHPQPNLAHYLFGFDLKKNVKKTIFHHAGVKGTPRTCLHVMLSIMDAAVTSKTTLYMVPPHPSLLETCYSMLYYLCANNNTREPVLNYLRTCSNFLARHLAAVRFGPEYSSSELNQVAWLLKIIAIELRETAASKQIPHLTSLVDLLVREPSSPQESTQEPVRTYKLIENEQYLFRPKGLGITQKPKSRQTLLVLLHFLDFQVPGISQPAWEFFEPAQISQLIAKCQISSVNGNLVDVKKLHKRLMEQLQILQNTSNTAQRPLVMGEIQEVLKYAIRINKQRQRSSATVHYVDAWRQVIEVMFITAPLDVLPYETRQDVLLDAVQLLLWKVTSSQPTAKLANLSSGTLMLLLVNLRSCYKMQKKEDHTAAKQNELSMTLQTKSAVLDLILTNIIEWILRAGAKLQGLRANLYAALLNFLHMTCQNGVESYDEEPSEGSMFISRLDSSKYRSFGTDAGPQHASCLNIVRSFGESLIDVLCHDCTGGHDICKMLALSCIGLLIELDPHTNWIAYLSSRGYLKYIIDSLLDADEKLVAVLEPVPRSVSALYVYESKMAMLCRVAASHSGAEMLLEHGLMGCLSSMSIFDRHPDIRQSVPNLDVNILPSVTQRFLQILFPALDLCDSVLTSLTPDNQSCCSQIHHFLLSHSVMVCTVLRAAGPSLPMPFLSEVARITGIIARCTNFDFRGTRDFSDVEVSGQMQRIQKLMLTLLPRFVVTEKVLKDLGSQEAVTHFLQTACHLALHTRNLVASRGVDPRATVVVLRPSLGDRFTPFDHHHARELQNIGEGGSPSLGVMVYQLVQTVSYQQKEAAALELLVRQKNSLSSMSGAELKQFLPEGASHVKALPTRRSIAAQELEKRIRRKKWEMKLIAFLLDNSLYLVWCHLDYYMLRAIPRSRFGDSTSGVLSTLSEMSWQISADDVSNLKQSLVSVFNDSFSKQLIETKKDHSAIERGFVEAMLRRIKRLIQFAPVK
ncbi:nuclear pore complex protein Nup205 [Schistocerca americana]|uniref:nuclear pore complex protein Nup205 n=1 Tax=Schistocerca americana TaxID=7009 RepID=UPI001F4F1756|nr:nuclear pore complex protein Nup205 [Schistocerca americana]